jgi:hypothetical protein
VWAAVCVFVYVLVHEGVKVVGGPTPHIPEPAPEREDAKDENDSRGKQPNPAHNHAYYRINARVLGDHGACMVLGEKWAQACYA